MDSKLGDTLPYLQESSSAQDPDYAWNSRRFCYCHSGELDFRRPPDFTFSRSFRDHWDDLSTNQFDRV